MADNSNISTIAPSWAAPAAKEPTAKDDSPLRVPFQGSSQQGPNFKKVFVDPEEPTATDSFYNVVMPNLTKGLIEGATALVDIPITLTGTALGIGADLLGYEEAAERLKNPVLASDVVAGVYEAPAIIEEAITGEPPTITAGFDATPRKGLNKDERFWGDAALIAGGGLSFPTALARAFGTLKGPLQNLLRDAGDRGVNSEAARQLLKKASGARGPNAVRETTDALVEAAREYAKKFSTGLGLATKRTVAIEQGLAVAAGIGYGAPELLADEDGRIEMDLGDGLGPVDVAPTLRIIGSLGLPILIQHGPSGIVAAGGQKTMDLIKYVTGKARIFGKSLVAGLDAEGQKDMASRIFNEMESDPGVLENVFLPAVESGQFSSPGSSTPIKILEDGTVVPAYGGINPDTLQALKLLGVPDTRLAELDATLKGRGRNAQTRLVEQTRRSEKLDETFNLLKSHLGSGDEASAYAAMEKARKNLDDQAVASLETAIDRAADIFKTLEPSIGRAEASKRAVGMLEGARLASREVTRKLFSKELIGTDFVDTRDFGEWAVKVITERGSRNVPITPGMSYFYKLAGQARLAREGLLPSGRPITDADLKGVKGDGDNLLTLAEIPENGLYDIFGEAGTVYAAPVKIETLQNFRSLVGDSVRAAYKAGNAKVGERLHLIIDYIDDEILVAKNFVGKVAPENIRNIEIGREYVKSAMARFGPNSEIGKQLFKGDDKIDEGFLTRLIKSGAESGQRVELFRNALNEPQQIIQNGNTTWQRDPAASLSGLNDPNVIEAELLRRFTESIGDGVVTQKHVDRFLTQYDEAIDTIPDLRGRLNDLKAAQSIADAMAAKITIPDRDTVLRALRDGATLEDVANAQNINFDHLTDRRLANAAAEYINVDPDKAASSFINAKGENAAKRSDQIAALLAKDETGQAERGFRAALWRTLRENSRNIGSNGEVLPGIDTKKLVKTIDDNRVYLEKFYNKTSMAYLDSLVEGGPLQQAGIDISAGGASRDGGRASFGARELVSAGGRSLGQYAFQKIGINTLAAAATGRRIAGYTFSKMGEKEIYKYVEDALRDPEKAAELVRRYRDSVKWEPPAGVKQAANELLENPAGVAGDVAVGAKDRLVRAASHTTGFLKGHSREAIARAVRFGLIPAQAEATRTSLDEDYDNGPPFDYEDNRIRYQIEQSNRLLEQSNRPPLEITLTRPEDIGGEENTAPRRPQINLPKINLPEINNNPNPASVLGQTSSSPAGTVSPETVPRMMELGMPLFQGEGFNRGGYVSEMTEPRMEHSGIMSVRNKPRQLVG